MPSVERPHRPSTTTTRPSPPRRRRRRGHGMECTPNKPSLHPITNRISTTDVHFSATNLQKTYCPVPLSRIITASEMDTRRSFCAAKCTSTVDDVGIGYRDGFRCAARCPCPPRRPGPGPPKIGRGGSPRWLRRAWMEDGIREGWMDDCRRFAAFVGQSPQAPGGQESRV